MTRDWKETGISKELSENKMKEIGFPK